MAGPLISSFHELVERVAPTMPRWFFIQVGANDPRRADPIYQYVLKWRWHGILVEPQSWVFEHQLLPAYENCPGLAFENAAIAETSGKGRLYKLSVSRERWATGLASLRKEQLMAAVTQRYVERNLGMGHADLPADAADYVEVEVVQTLSWSSLLDKHRPKNIDLLQIDAEGLDYSLLKWFDFDRYRPRILNFEHLHMTDPERADTTARLCGLGYLCFEDGINWVAVLQSLADRLGLAFSAPRLRRPSFQWS